MAEKEQTDRHKKSAKIIHDEFFIEKMSLIFAFFIALFAIVLSGILFYMDKDGAAITIIIGDLLAFGGAFIYGHKKLKEEEKKK